MKASFNPSVGILLVWTYHAVEQLTLIVGFNPSVGILLVWTLALSMPRSIVSTVSIPRSGFCWFGPGRCVGWQTCSALVSIPRSGFCWFGLGIAIYLLGRACEFQSLGRDSVGLDQDEWQGHLQLTACFNPSVGILLVWTERHIGAPDVAGRVSIPRSGFCWFGP